MPVAFNDPRSRLRLYVTRRWISTASNPRQSMQLQVINCGNFKTCNLFHPLTTSGIHVFLSAIYWVLWRILHRFWLPFTMWGEPCPPPTSLLAETHIGPGPISGPKAPHHVLSNTAIISQLHHGQTAPSIFPELYQLELHFTVHSVTTSPSTFQTLDHIWIVCVQSK
jgi:hypothetical protein